MKQHDIDNFGLNNIPLIEAPWMLKDQIMLLNLKTRPAYVREGEVLSPLDLLERGVDWHATAKASILIKNIGDPE